MLKKHNKKENNEEENPSSQIRKTNSKPITTFSISELKN
jgi:hypothetical protein